MASPDQGFEHESLTAPPPDPPAALLPDPPAAPLANPMILRRHVAGNIAACRRRAGLSQAEVGRMLGLEKETVCRIEKAKISVTVDRLQEFAALFQCSLRDFL